MSDRTSEIFDKALSMIHSAIARTGRPPLLEDVIKDSGVEKGIFMMMLSHVGRRTPELRATFYARMGLPMPELKERKPYTRRAPKELDAPPPALPTIPTDIDQKSDVDVLAQVIAWLAGLDSAASARRVLRAASAFFQPEEAPAT